MHHVDPRTRKLSVPLDTALPILIMVDTTVKPSR